MRPSPRLYLLIVLTPLAGLVCGNVLLNIWIDPLDTLRDQRMSAHDYALPAVLTEFELPANSEPDIDVFLLGTSRTLLGFDTRRVPEVINLGISGSSERMIDNLLVGLLQSSTRPHVYFVETMGARGGIYRMEKVKLLRYLLSGGTTKQSLRQIADRLRNSSIPNTVASPDHIAPRRPAKEDQDLAQQRVSYLRDSLPVQPDTRALIERRVERLRELQVPQDALVIYYDAPQSLICRSDPKISAALQARSRLWRQVVAECNAAQPSSQDVNSAAADRPRVTVAYVSYATPDEWGEPAAPEVWAEASWWDTLHFKPATGQRLLDRLMNVAAKNDQTAKSP